MSARPDHLELAERLIDLHRHTMDLIGDILRRSTSTDAPSPIQAIPRALEKQGSDSDGAVGARERGILRTGSEQTPTAEAQGRNEPASVEAVAGATAGEVGIASSPAPRDLKRDIILNHWNEGKLTRAEIALAAGSNEESVRAVVNDARRAGDARALHKRCFRDVPTASEIAAEVGVTAKAAESVIARAKKAGDSLVAKKAGDSLVAKKAGDSLVAKKPSAPKPIQEFAGKGRGGDGDGVQSTALACGNASMPGLAKPTHDAANDQQREIARDFLAKRDAPIEPKPKPRIMSTKEVMARLAGEVAARAVTPASDPYSKPMEPIEANPIPVDELPAQVPVFKVSDDKVMIVADGVVHGPYGIEERLGPKEIKILARLADGGMYPDSVLSDVSGATNGTFTYLMNGMRGKLAGIGVELFAPMKGFWRARRAS